MKNRVLAGFIFILISAYFLFVPTQTVWGGWSWQTVPTMGPQPSATITGTISATPSPTVQRTFTPTATLSSGNITLVPGVTSSPNVNTPTNTDMPTNALGDLTVTLEELDATRITVDDQTRQTPLSGSASPTQEIPATEAFPKNSSTEIQNAPPFWLLPLTCSLAFVVLILLIRLVLIRRLKKK